VAEETDSDTGTGRDPKKVANGLDSYQPRETTAAKTTTMPSGFNGETSSRPPVLRARTPAAIAAWVSG